MSKEQNKITDEQLAKINDQQRALNILMANIGGLEAQKHSLLHNLAELNKEIEDTKVELEAIYGAVNINLQDGTYIPIEDKKE